MYNLENKNIWIFDGDTESELGEKFLVTGISISDDNKVLVYFDSDVMPSCELGELTEYERELLVINMVDGIEDWWEFVELFHPNYNCQMIGDIDDICKVLDNDYEEDQVEYLQDYIDMDDDELQQELDRLNLIVLEDSVINFINKNK